MSVPWPSRTVSKTKGTGAAGRAAAALPPAPLELGEAFVRLRMWQGKPANHTTEPKRISKSTFDTDTTEPAQHTDDQPGQDVEEQSGQAVGPLDVPGAGHVSPCGDVRGPLAPHQAAHGFQHSAAALDATRWTEPADADRGRAALGDGNTLGILGDAYPCATPQARTPRPSHWVVRVGVHSVHTSP